jgi:hypothetical protein
VDGDGFEFHEANIKFLRLIVNWYLKMDRLETQVLRLYGA